MYSLSSVLSMSVGVSYGSSVSGALVVGASVSGASVSGASVTVGSVTEGSVSLPPTVVSAGPPHAAQERSVSIDSKRAINLFMAFSLYIILIEVI